MCGNRMTSLAEAVESKVGTALAENASESTKRAAPKRSLTWAEAETMDILEDEDMMAGIAEGKEDVKAGRLIEWKPRDVKNTQST